MKKETSVNVLVSRSLHLEIVNAKYKHGFKTNGEAVAFFIRKAKLKTPATPEQPKQE